MSIHTLARHALKLLSDNAPTILTAVGVAGTIGTAYLAGKASFAAAEIIRVEEQENYAVNGTPIELPTKDAVKLVWKQYLPAVGMGAGTIFCIVAANRIGVRRAAALVAAFKLSEKRWEEYKAKVVEELGPKKDKKIRDELAQEQLSKNPRTKEIIMITPGDVICQDGFSGRYFRSNMQALQKAENQLNAEMINNGYASLGYFYSLIGLPTTDHANIVGWNTDRLLELDFSSTLDDNGDPCLSVNYIQTPTIGYDKKR